MLVTPTKGQSPLRDPGGLYAERGVVRYLCRLPGRLLSGPFGVRCQVLDLSSGGAQLRVHDKLSWMMREEDCHLSVTGLGSFPVALIWAENRMAGLRFVLPEEVRPALQRRISMVARMPKEGEG